MRVGVIRITESDRRLFRIEDGYRYGHYLERDKPAPQNTRAILCVYRVPTGTQAPKGRISDAALLRLANEGAQEAEPEVIARFPYWSSVDPVEEVPDDTAVEPVEVLPPSLRDAQGAYVEPPHSTKPVPAAEPEPEPEKAAPAKAEKTEKGGG